MVLLRCSVSHEHGNRSTFPGIPGKFLFFKGWYFLLLTIFIVAFLIALGLVFVGELVDFTVTIVGLVLLVALGAFLLGFYGTGLEYVSGHNTTFTYSYLNNSNTSVSQITQSSQDYVTTFSNDITRLIGFILVTGGILGMVGVFIEIKRYRRSEKDAEA